MMTGYSLQTRRRFVSFPCGVLIVGILAGCAGGGGDPSATSGLDRAERSVASSREVRASPREADGAGSEDSGRVIAEVDGIGLRMGELRSRLVEASASAMLDEMVLDVRLARRCASAGIEIDDAALASERELIERSLIGAGVAPGSEGAGRLLERVRRERGLGEVRYAALIRRNAMLRALIAPAATPTESEVRRAYEARYGARRVVRLVTSPTLEEATRIVDLARGGADFSELATRFSTDRSAARGGLLEPMSTSDESYPLAVREAVASLPPGGVSGVIALDEGYAVLSLERVIEPRADAPAFDGVRDELAEESRRRRERILMSELATRLRAETGEVRVFDAEIREAWRSRPSTQRP